MKNKTHATKKEDQQPEWYLVDVADQVLGRAAVQISRILMGKNKVNYVPYLDMGDHVVVINASKVAVTGSKRENKLYQRHTGYPGGFRELTFKKMMEKKPTEIIRKAVWGMMPKTRMGKAMMKKLHVSADSQHKYSDKKLKELKL